MLDRLFRLKAHGTTVRTEVLAGLTTFLTMAYIIFVQPAVLSGAMFGIDTGMDFGAVTTATCLAAALAYLMIHQQDPVGLITFADRIQDSLPPKSKRTQLGALLSLLARLEPSGKTDVAHSLTQLAAMLRHRSLVMVARLI